MDNFRNYYETKNCETQNCETSRLKFSRKSIALLTALCIFVSTGFGFVGALLANSIAAKDGSSMQSSSANQINLAIAKTLPDLVTGNTLIPGSNLIPDSKLITGSELTTSSELTIKEIVDLTANSVVEIKTEAVVTDPWMQQYVTKGAGSGVIISSDGYIVTNNHVVEGSNKISVTLKNNTTYSAILVGSDPETDIAVLKIDAKRLTPAVYGDSDLLEVGDLSVVIGNPLGSLGGTVTSGIVSALDRSITIDGKTMKLLQTDASINPGNSGGGMFNKNGELVGIIVAKSSGSDVEGLGFAIPVNEIKTVAKELADYGYVRGRIDTGLTFVDLTSMGNAIFYGVRNLGIYIKSVDNDNAAAAGFKSGDLVYYIEDKKIDSAAALTSAFADYSVGDTVEITVIRDNEMKTIKLVLAEKTTP